MSEPLYRALRMLGDAIEGSPSTKTYPLSHAVYDIAKAISDRPDPVDLVPALEGLATSVETAGETIAKGLHDVADAIRYHR